MWLSSALPGEKSVSMAVVSTAERRPEWPALFITAGQPVWLAVSGWLFIAGSWLLAGWRRGSLLRIRLVAKSHLLQLACQLCVASAISI